jgi:hypothetical protein
VEPVPLFRAFLEYSAARNHLSHLIEVLPALVAADAAVPYTVNVPLAGSWGQAGVHVQQQATQNMLQVLGLCHWMVVHRQLLLNLLCLIMIASALCLCGHNVRTRIPAGRWLRPTAA